MCALEIREYIDRSDPRLFLPVKPSPNTDTNFKDATNAKFTGIEVLDFSSFALQGSDNREFVFDYSQLAEFSNGSGSEMTFKLKAAQVSNIKFNAERIDDIGTDSSEDSVITYDGDDIGDSGNVLVDNGKYRVYENDDNTSSNYIDVIIDY